MSLPGYSGFFTEADRFRLVDREAAESGPDDRCPDVNVRHPHFDLFTLGWVGGYCRSRTYLLESGALGALLFLRSYSNKEPTCRFGV